MENPLDNLFVPTRGGDAEKLAGSIIITGGAGFVASYLAERLLIDEQFSEIKKIYLIDNLVRTNSTRNIDHLLSNPRVQFIHGDISTFEYEDYFDPFSVSWIFHLAATRINRCNERMFEGHQYIATGGARLIDWASRYTHIKLFFASSASVYQSPKRLPIEETDNCSPRTIYGAGKLYTENLIKSYNQLFGMDYVIHRFFSIYGVRMDNAGSYTEVIFNWLNQIKKGNKDIFVYGNPDEKILDLVYVTDVIDAIILSMNSNNKTYNISTQVGITLTDLIAVIEKVTNTTLNRVFLKEDRIDIEKARIGDVSKLKLDTNWEPKVSIEEGIKKTWEWINE